MTLESILHLLRNPYGHPQGTLRQSRLEAAEMLEKLSKQLAAPARQEMWVVSKGANEMLFHTEDQAERYIAGLPAPRSKGWEIGKLPVYAAPQGEGK